MGTSPLKALKAFKALKSGNFFVKAFNDLTLLLFLTLLTINGRVI